MSFRLRQSAAVALASLLAVGMFAPGCSQQGEGERCDFAKSGSASCDDGLQCRKTADLLDKSSDRCCPAGETFNDQRCTPKLTSDGSGGDSSQGTGGGGDEPVGGMPPSTGGSPEETAAGGKAGEAPSSSGGAGAGGEAGAAAIVLPSAGQGGSL